MGNLSNETRPMHKEGVEEGEREENEEDEDAASVEIIQNAMKQVAFASNRDRAAVPERQRTVAQKSSTEASVRVDDRGGPDFKAQTDSRSHVAGSIVRAQPAQAADQPADFYGQAARVHIQRVEEMPEHMVIVTAEPATTERWSSARKPPSNTCRTNSSSMNKPPQHLRKSAKRFWLTVISTGILVNMLLVSGLMFLWLYFTGNLGTPAPAQPAVVVLASFAPTPSPSQSIPFNYADYPWGVDEGTSNLIDTSSNGASVFTVNGSPPVASGNGIPGNNTHVDETGRHSSNSTEILDDDAVNDSPQNAMHRYYIPSVVSFVAVLLEVVLVTKLFAYHRRWKAQRVVAEEATLPVDSF